MQHHRSFGNGALAVVPHPGPLGLYPAETLKKELGRKSAIKASAASTLSAMAAPLTRSDIRGIAEGIAGAIHDEPGYVIDHPILIARGASDNLGNISKVAARWHARDPRSTLTTIPDAGHVANMDNPAAFNAIMLEFLTTARDGRSLHQH